MNDSLLLVAFPVGENEALSWWHVADGAVQSSGCDAEPLNAAGFNDIDEEPEFTCIALVPAASTRISWHETIEAVTENQSLAVAIDAAKQSSLESDHVHIAAAAEADGKNVTAVIAEDILARGLALLQAKGLNPDVVVPAGWLVPVAQDIAVLADFGFDRVIRSSAAIFPDESPFHELMAQDHAVVPVIGDAFDDMLIHAGQRSQLNFRSGEYAKPIGRRLDPKQKRLIVFMAAALLLITLLIPCAQLVKYHWAAGSADDRALASAATIISGADDLESAEQALDQRMVAENRGYNMFPVPASALFSALQQSPNVTVERLSYDANGIVSATLSAVRNEDINPTLIAVQNAGFQITATPRTDTTGSAKADITVRAP